jgi:uncharacterized iron-regulated membrane protein
VAFSSLLGDEYLVGVILLLFLLAALGGIRKWWKHRKETRDWLSGRDTGKSSD